MKLPFAWITGLLTTACCLNQVQAQAPVRGLPGAVRVYSSGAYGQSLPLSPSAYPQAVVYPQPAIPANTYYRPVIGYVPAGQTNNGYVAAGYAPVNSPTGWAGVTTGYAPATSPYAAPVAAAPVVTGYTPAPLATPAPATTASTPVYSPFVRPAPNYTPPNFVYRPSSAPNYVTYYRPVTVNDPVTGVPVTYMGACRGTECRPQPQTSYFGSLFSHHHKPCNSCASSACGARPATPAPYYTPPAGALPGATIPQQPVIIPTTPTTPQPYYPPPTTTFPGSNPPLPRSTVPPPGTAFPPSSFTTPPAGATFTPSPSGTMTDPASMAPVLQSPPATLSPSGAVPGVNFNQYPPASDPNGATTTLKPQANGQPYTEDGKTFYYYKGTVKEAFSDSPTTTNDAAGTKAAKPMTEKPAEQSPMIQPPANGNQPPVNNESYHHGYTPGVGPLRLDVRPSSLTKEPTSKPEVSLDGGRMVPVPQQPVQSDSLQPLPLNPSIRPLPDPEPNGPVNRAPQLLNPRDKTA